MTPAPILVVEDDARAADTLRLYLERAGLPVELAADGEAALLAFRRRAPRLIVLDLVLPGRDGLDVCRTVRASSSVPVLMLTARDTEDDVVRGLRQGADDYVVKPYSPRELVARVEALLRRTPQAARLAAGDLVLDLVRHEAWLGDDAVLLTPAEFALLATLARHPGRLCRREELLARARPHAGSAPRAIDAHMVNLRRKLGGRGPRIESVYGLGYRLAGASA